MPGIIEIGSGVGAWLMDCIVVAGMSHAPNLGQGFVTSTSVDSLVMTELSFNHFQFRECIACFLPM
jgi:hypothetical protein